MQDVAFDLDGTLADYTGGYKVHSDFPGEPFEWVRSQLQRLVDAGFCIGILTTRNARVAKRWVEEHKLGDLISWVNVNPNQPPGCGLKPIASHYVGDRMIRFEGNMDEIVDGIIDGRFTPAD